MKSTKRSLIYIAVSLIICIAMLLGTTYAWFTDSAASGKNKIISGNLDVSLEYWNGTEYADAVDAYVFDPSTLWEPGHTEVAYLKVVNSGTLTLKYRMMLSPLYEEPGTNVFGNEFYLSDHLVFAMIEGMDPSAGELFETRDEAAEQLEGISYGLEKWSDEKILAPGENEIITVAVMMPNTVDNIANYRGSVIPQINLGITVYAAQKEAEEDAFGDDYDHDAEYSVEDSLHRGVPEGFSIDDETMTVTVSSAEALKHLSDWSKLWGRTSSGEQWNLVLGGNIDLENTVIDAPIDLSAFRSFVGNHYTVSNVSVNILGVEEEAGLFKNLPATEKLKVSNITVSAPGAANVGIIAGKTSAGASLTEITVSDSGAAGKQNVGGVFGSGTSGNISNIVIENVSLTGSIIGGVAGEYSGTAEGVSKITVNGLKVDGEEGSVAGGIFGSLKDSKNFSVSEYTITNITMVRTILVGSVTGKVIGIYDTVISLDSAYVVRDQDGNIIAINGMGKITLADFSTEKLIALAKANGMKLPQNGVFFNGHCYAFLNRDTKMLDGSSTGSWGVSSEADNNVCKSFGGHAATISSAEEESVIRNLAGSSAAYIGGMRSSNTSSDYHWLNGETFDMSLVNWKNGEPSNDSYNGGKKYLAITSSGWLTAYKNQCLNFICEWDIIDLINK